MSLKTLVKVGEVNNLSDARYCAGMGAEYIGFQLDETNEKFVDVTTYTAITGWLEGVKFVGEFENSTAAQIFEKYTQYNFEVVQISNPTQLLELASLQIPKILKIEVQNIQELTSIDYSKANYLVLESSSIDNITEKEVKVLKELCQAKPTVLGFGFSDENINDLLEKIKPAGIALKGGTENSPGTKTYDELADIFEAIEIDNF